MEANLLRIRLSSPRSGAPLDACVSFLGGHLDGVKNGHPKTISLSDSIRVLVSYRSIGGIQRPESLWIGIVKTADEPSRPKTTDVWPATWGGDDRRSMDGGREP